MVEKEEIFSTKMKSSGIFTFKEFYQFCYEWLRDETQLNLAEEKYEEKIAGDAKEIKIEWKGTRKVTDYFKYEIKVKYRVTKLKEIELTQEGRKIKTNQGDVEMKIAGSLLRDYEGKFEKGAFRKFLRSIYEKWVIPARIEQYEEKLIGDCDEFLAQAKAFLALEGKR
ncbi:hypothetical protein J4225_04395 [Candidatus Pacearchaeota archaeon]|nr:hypothetical protein [Candidatus Pacearchaeota archaeon]